MMAVDSDINGGVNNNLIQNTFAARGVGNFVPIDVTISGPSQLDAGETGTWTANVSNGTSPYSYIWYYRPEGDNSWGQVGTGSSYSHGTGDGQTDYWLRVEVTDANSRPGSDDQYVVVGTFVPPGH